MIIKTLHVVCDHDGCERFSEGERGVSQALPLIRQIRALGWVASDGRQYCPEHIDMADVGSEWWERQHGQARMRKTITEAAATLDGLPPEMREQMAHRTLLRKQEPAES